MHNNQPNIEDRIIAFAVIGFWSILILFGLISFAAPAWLVNLSNPGKHSEALDLKHMGDQLLRSKKYRQAAANYKRALEIKPDLNAAAGNLGIVYSKLGRMEDALETFEYALALNPEIPHTSYHNMAEIYEKTNRLDEACHYYELCTKTEPLPAYAYAKAGAIHLKRKRFAQAIDAFNNSLDSRQSMLQLYRGMLLKEKYGRSNTSDERSHIDKLLEQSSLPGALDAYDTLVFNWGLKWDHEIAKTYSYMGNAYTQSGNLNQAISNYKKALKIWPEFRDAKQNMEIVANLREQFQQKQQSP